MLPQCCIDTALTLNPYPFFARQDAQPQACSPAIARAAARACGAATAATLSLVDQLAPLLAYCVSDLLAAGRQLAASNFEEAAAELAGLHLLPCKDGSLAAFAQPPGSQVREQPAQQRPVFALASELEQMLLASLGEQRGTATGV